MPYKKLIIFSTIIFVLSQGMLRYNSRRLVERADGKVFYREYDMRGDQVELFRKRSEREFFKVKGGFADAVSIPGLSSMDFSMTWLRILASVYEDVTIEGDFSWLFHKLRFISYLLPPDEAAFQTALLPMFIVLGKDPAGAVFLVNEKIAKFKTDWRILYWAGFHALENLKEKKMAGYFFLEATRYSGAPGYLSALGVRLSQGDDEIEFSVLRKFATENLSPEILEKLKKIRPEWFKDSEK